MGAGQESNLQELAYEANMGPSLPATLIIITHKNALVKSLEKVFAFGMNYFLDNPCQKTRRFTQPFL